MRWLTILFGVIFVIQATLLFRVRIARTYPEAFILAIVLGFVLVQTMSDLLDLLGIFGAVAIAVFWGGVAFGGSILLWLARRHIRATSVRLSKFEWITYGTTALLTLLTLLTGLLVAPNNWDSLSYHLPRAAHWLQQGSLDFFPTSNQRQNVMTPLPSLLHAQFLSAPGGERFAFLSQWCAGVAILVSVGILATLITRGRRGVALSVLVAATVPMFLSQMSTTQSDLMAGLPIAGSIVGTRWILRGRGIPGIVLTSVVVALAIAIKPTSIIFLIPVCIFIVITLMRQHEWAGLCLLSVLTLSCTLVLNGSYAVRMLQSLAELPTSATAVLNAEFGAGVTVLNLLRSLALLVSIPVSSVNGFLEGFVRNSSRTLGIDPDSPVSTFGEGFRLPMVWSEDHAGAPIHVALVITALMIAAISRHRAQYKRVFLLAGLVLIALVGLAAAFRWQIWGNRFYFLVLVFAAPIVGAVLESLRDYLQTLVCLMLGTSAILWVLLQPLRGLAGTAWLPDEVRESTNLPAYESPLTHPYWEQMLAYHPRTAPAYERALQYTYSLNPSAIELHISDDWWEYPLWAMNQHAPSPRIPFQTGGDLKRDGLESPAAPDGLNPVVHICVGRCELNDLQVLHTIESDPDPSAPEMVGPRLTIGLVRGMR